MKSRFLSFLFLLCSFSLFAQRDTICRPDCNRIYIGGSVQYGFLWSHRYNMGHLVKKHIVSGELDVTFASDGDYCWNKPYHYPWTGVALHVIPLGNPDQLGTAIGLYPYINFPLGKYDHRFKLNMRYGWGIGWLTKKFDPIDNHKNIAIGSHLNTCFTLRLNGMYKITDDHQLEFGLGITHFSNGASRLPNLGINLPMISAGYFFSSGARVCKRHTPEADARNAHTESLLYDHRWHFAAMIVAGANDIEPPGGRHFGVLNVVTTALRPTSRKHRFGGGIDIMYSQAVQHHLVYDSVNVNAIGATQLGAKFCYELVLGRLSLPGEIGVYLYSRYKENGPVYNRFGLRYLATDHLLLSFTLKTHFAKAEYFEVGAGWRF